MGQIWAIENDHGAWIVEVGAAVTFDRLQHDGHVLASGIVDAPIRMNPHGMVTHLKVRGVHGESRSILVPVSTFRSVRARRRVSSPCPRCPRQARSPSASSVHDVRPAHNTTKDR